VERAPSGILLVVDDEKKDELLEKLLLEFVADV